MYTLNGWWFLSSSGSYPPGFMVGVPAIARLLDPREKPHWHISGSFLPPQGVNVLLVFYCYSPIL